MPKVCIICGAAHAVCGQPFSGQAIDIPRPQSIKRSDFEQQQEAKAMALREGDRRVQYRRADGGVFNIDPNSEMGKDWIANNPGVQMIERTERQSEPGIARPEVEAGGDVNAMNLNQLKRYAAEHSIDLGDAKLKADILAKIVEAQPQDGAPGAEQD